MKKRLKKCTICPNPVFFFSSNVTDRVRGVTAYKPISCQTSVDKYSLNKKTKNNTKKQKKTIRLFIMFSIIRSSTAGGGSLPSDSLI